MGKCKKTIFLFFTLLIMHLIIFHIPIVEADRTNSTGNDVIILYKNNQGKQEIIKKSEEIDYEFKTIPAISATVNDEQLEDLENDSHIEAVEPNLSFSLFQTGQEQTAQVFSFTPPTPWNINAINVNQAWGEGYSGKGVKVAVLDTGISNHPELKISGGISTVDYTTSWVDDNGHGTHVSGIIAAQKNVAEINGTDIVGVAPNVNLFSVKVLDKNGKGCLSDILEGLDWAIFNHMDIVNVSFGTDELSPIFQELINKAYKQGMLIVAASGNDGLNNSVEYPAKFSNAIAVSSVNKSLVLSPFTSKGKEVEFTAPGEEITSTYKNRDYYKLSGTSQATPHVTGMLALLKEKFPNATNAQLRNLLKENSIDLGVAGRDSLYGYGLVYYDAKSKDTETTPDPPIDDSKKPVQTTINVYGVALKEQTNVYAAQSRSKILKSYQVGSILKYQPYNSNWYKATVYVDGKATTGYIAVKDVETANNLKKMQGFASQNDTKVYSVARENSKILKSYSTGKVLKYTSFVSNWYQAVIYINSKKYTGYIYKDDVVNIDKSKSVTLNTVASKSRTNVYSQSSSGSSVIKSYSKGSVLKVQTFSSDWYKATVYKNGRRLTGFIRVRDVELINQAKINVTGTSIGKPTKVYQSPTNQSKVLKKYSYGQTLKLRTYTNNWYEATVYVNKKKYVGYIPKNQVRR